MEKIKRSIKGFTLVELLVAVLILGFVLGGLIQVFIRCSALSQLARNKTAVMSELQGEMEKIRNYSYDAITTDYVAGGPMNLNPFDLDQVTGKGVIYIDASNSELLEIKIVASWEDKYGRIIGGDFDLDGEVDTGETLDGDGDLTSIARVISLVARR